MAADKELDFSSGRTLLSQGLQGLGRRHRGDLHLHLSSGLLLLRDHHLHQEGRLPLVLPPPLGPHLLKRDPLPLNLRHSPLHLVW